MTLLPCLFLFRNGLRLLHWPEQNLRFCSCQRSNLPKQKFNF
ncbi:hypothetical protein SLEP1_g13993 [Rubroshorea leprosula]|uniref:Uncharacterized protein n=1 Tax=Rubroshorea leprosula TaxID=152421 RepID=A0AAV5IHP0_9ROSI|nr:hypothetical protein SLEP1_g13993 [Rubroshorea leprosula]